MDPAGQVEALRAAEERRAALARELEEAERLRLKAMLDCKSAGLNATEIGAVVGLPTGTPAERAAAGSRVRAWLAEARGQFEQESRDRGGRPPVYASILTRDLLLDDLIDRRTMREIAQLTATSTSTVDRYLRAFKLDVAGIRAATSPRTAEGRLAEAAGSADFGIRCGAASNARTPRDALAGLTADPDERVRSYVAENRGLSQEDSAALRDDAAEPVRAAAEHEPGRLEELAKSETVMTRVRVARNPHTATDTLEELAGDREARVRLAVATQADLPRKVVETLCSDENAFVLLRLAGNPKTPDDVVLRLAVHREKSVRHLAAERQNAPGAAKAAAGLLND